MDLFVEIPCLTEKSSPLLGLNLLKKWFKKTEKRNLVQSLQKFRIYNHDVFQFLGVEPSIIGSDNDSALQFRSSNYIGTIPLRSPDTGKQIGDFVVYPRFTGKDKFEEYIQILQLLDEDISPEFGDSIPLASGMNFRPPLYLEAVKFIDAMEGLLKSNWRKFDTRETINSSPVGQVNWNKYVNHEYKVENKLKFPVRKSVINEYHKEFSQMRFVFDICKAELQSSKTPMRIRSSIKKRVDFLEQRLYSHKPVSVNQFVNRTADSQIVKECKSIANNILSKNTRDGTAWRVDFSDVFEKYTQHIFREVAKETGASLHSNFRFESSRGKRYSWELKHLEADAVYEKDETCVFIDAKYKSHFFNKFGESTKLKETYRHDLHQIMAYSSFSGSKLKLGILCYPSETVEMKTVEYTNHLNQVSTRILLCGIPLRVSALKESVIELKDALESINLVESY